MLSKILKLYCAIQCNWRFFLKVSNTPSFGAITFQTQSKPSLCSTFSKRYIHSNVTYCLETRKMLVSGLPPSLIPACLGRLPPNSILVWYGILWYNVSEIHTQVIVHKLQPVLRRAQLYTTAEVEPWTVGASMDTTFKLDSALNLDCY